MSSHRIYADTRRGQPLTSHATATTPELSSLPERIDYVPAPYLFLTPGDLGFVFAAGVVVGLALSLAVFVAAIALGEVLP